MVLRACSFEKMNNGRRLTRNSDNKLSPLILAVDGSHKLLSSVQKKYLICLVVLGNPFGRFKGINTTPFVRQEKNEWYQLTLWVVIVNLKLTNWLRLIDWFIDWLIHWCYFTKTQFIIESLFNIEPKHSRYFRKSFQSISSLAQKKVKKGKFVWNCRFVLLVVVSHSLYFNFNQILRNFYMLQQIEYHNWRAIYLNFTIRSVGDV